MNRVVIRTPIPAIIAACSLLLAGCGLPRPFSPDSDPRKPPRVEAPTPTPPPPRVPAVLLPRSDEAWLIEMLIQRLELSAAIAVLESAPPDPAFTQARLVAIAEEAARAGLPRETAQDVFAAQLAAASAEARIARKKPRMVDPGYAASVLPTLEAQRQTVDTQIIVTLLRLKNLPGGRIFLDFARKQFDTRGISRAAARTALEPFNARTKALRALPGDGISASFQPVKPSAARSAATSSQGDWQTKFSQR